VPEALRDGPRALPEAAKRLKPTQAVTLGAAVALQAVAAGLALAIGRAAPEAVAGALLLMLLATLMAMRLAWRLARRKRLLAGGVPVAGRVVSAWAAGPKLLLKYEYRLEGRAFEGEAVEDVISCAERGVVPRANDTVFLVIDPARPTRNLVWGYGRAQE
jgi:hypothetical protein